MGLQGYGSYTQEAAEDETKELERVFGAKIIKFPVGKTYVRIMPLKPPAKSPFTLIWQHFVTIKGKHIPIVCPSENSPKGTPKLPCPICVKAEQMRTSGDEAQAQRGAEIRAQRKWYASAILRGSEDDGIRTWSAGKEIMVQVNRHHKELAAAGRDFTDPYQGFDLMIERTGTGVEDTEYTVGLRGGAQKPHAMDLSEGGPSDSIMQAWLNGRIDFGSRLTSLPSAESIMMRLKGGRQPQPSESTPSAQTALGGDPNGGFPDPEAAATTAATETPAAASTVVDKAPANTEKVAEQAPVKSAQSEPGGVPGLDDPSSADATEAAEFDW